MDTVTIQASFASQEQAEAAVRKLAALRGDRFRIERASAQSQTQASMSDADALLSMDGLSESGAADYGAPPAEAADASFTLSANVPASAGAQARSVIDGAGGRML